MNTPPPEANSSNTGSNPPSPHNQSNPSNPSNHSGSEHASASWGQVTLEKWAFAALEEQKQARRWRTFIRLSWLVVLIIAGIITMYKNTGPTTSNVAHTAVVEIKGEISADSDASAEWIIQALKDAFEDENSKAVIILINSPGGSPVQAGMINDEIRRLKAKHKIPVYAVVEETCASAAYYIAVAADNIYVDKASIVGSIGVLMDGFGFTSIMDKVGVERRLLTAGENKGFMDPFSPLSKAHKAFAQNMLEQIHQQFIGVVKEGRGERLKDSPDLFSGLFWTGQQAIEMGLADGLGSVDFVAREIVKAEDLVDYTKRDNVAERLAKRFGAAMGAGAIKALKTWPEVH